MENSGKTAIRIRFSVYLIMLVFFTVNTNSLIAQSYDNLKPLAGFKSKVYFSDGNDKRANIIAERMDRVYNYFNARVSFEPHVTILLLNPADWPKFTTFPVYGMPHYDEKRDLLIMACDNNEFWDSFIPQLDKLPANFAGKISETYSDGNGSLTMQAFFDLLAIHEIGHAYHFQAGLNMQRKWMGELFCNILLHTYIAENEPEQLNALTVFPQMVISGGKDRYKYTSLSDIENLYDVIGQNHPGNYGWYQSRWHSSAEQIFNTSGPGVFDRLWNALKQQNEKLDNEEFTDFLMRIDKSLADVVLKWDD